MKTSRTLFLKLWQGTLFMDISIYVCVCNIYTFCICINVRVCVCVCYVVGLNNLALLDTEHQEYPHKSSYRNRRR